MTTRHALHDWAVGFAAEVLRANGYTVELQPANRVSSAGPDLIVDGRPVAVRFANERAQTHRVTTNNRTYEYRYPVSQWSLHVHGALRYRPELWALVARTADGELLYFVPESAVVRRKTVGILHTRLRTGKLAQYLLDHPARAAA